MVSNILIGLDGSPFSEAATELGALWARRTQAMVVGLGVVDEPTILRPEPTGIGGGSWKSQRDAALLADAHARVATFLERFTARCTAAGVPSRVVKAVGAPAEQILSLGEDAGLLLLGQQTFFHFETQASADRTLEAVLHRSHRPVVAVPQALPDNRAVVVAYDAQPPAVRALEAFQKSGWYEGQTVYVVSVAGDAPSAARQGEEGARFLRFAGMAAEARPLCASGPPAMSLLDQVRERGAGMLVLGAYGRSRFAETLFGSTTRSILKKSENVLLFLHH
jgi:nucleotide-binding universal stress UspA family protein